MHRPKEPGSGASWGFVVLPTEVSAKLPRRGRTTVDGTINGQGFRAMLEPDGKKVTGCGSIKHYLKRQT
ncbi:DUF1905 domain-containing protein [Oxalobacteraceae bacterium R-40]|uniref:DUF1905 domain-containing protein n=1 Tax=Keguizhuia sedimenti TaxID=3064264 RepID=A0ABU1BP37_9BURK|nr:DUF1905 domain-containing protein [Oxalobacteraceae bacterium R-40]